MKKLVKNVLSLSIFTAFALSNANAATYSIEEFNAIDTHENTEAVDQNIHGESVLLGSGFKEFPVQYQYLTEENFDSIIALAELQHENVSSLENIEDEAALKAGNPTDNDYQWVLVFLETVSGSSLYQKNGNLSSLINLTGTTEELVIFDTTFEGTDTLTRSTQDQVTGITDSGWIFGSGTAPYLPFELEQSDGDIETYWLRDFSNRAFYSLDKGETIIPLIPPESSYGGISIISDISETGVAIGYASTSISETLTSSIDNIETDCNLEENTATVPAIVCINANLNGGSLYSIEGYRWVIGSNGQITSQETLGNLITPHEDDLRAVSSFAQAVNDNGIIVGYADGWANENVTNPSQTQSRLTTYAVVFKDDRVVDLNPDRTDHFGSRATDINNNNIATGYMHNGQRNEFYYIDTTEVDNMEMTVPEGFFNGSASWANSINDQGLIVGSGEVETTTSTRRTHGFIYDISTDLFTDLNDYISCDDKDTTTIVDASKINENNEIFATVIVRVNATDSNGDEVLDDNGDVYITEVARAVKMTPIPSGEIVECSGDVDVDEKVERQGASLGFGLLFILTLLGFRRRT